MRLFLSLSLILALIAADAQSRSPVQKIKISENKISIQLNNISLKDALALLERKANISITYINTLVESRQIDHYTATDIPWDEVLNQILASFSLAYKKAGPNQIVLFQKVKVNLKPLKGKVIDAKTGEPLPGVTIREKGSNNGALTDGNGNFSILLQGEQPTLSLTYLGYGQQDILVNNQTFILIKLQEKGKTLNEVVVQSRKIVSSEITLLNERKNATVSSDGISAQQIEKTASITTTQALQRVSGVTITDDKYVAIRGLGERAVIAELNGARLSSANPDRSSVPLDLVPASLLDNITVYKDLTPDRPSDASAGIVELKTKSIPDSLSISVSAQVGFNSSIGLGGSVNSFVNSDPGFFGQNVKNHDLSKDFTDLRELYPGGITQIQRLFIESRISSAKTAEANRVNNLLLAFDPILAPSYKQVDPNQIYSATFGNSFFNKRIGIIVSANYYRRSEDRYNGISTQYGILQGISTGSSLVNNPLALKFPVSPNGRLLDKYLDLVENRGLETINYGVLFGTSFRIDPRNEISLQYLGSRGAEIAANSQNGQFKNTGFDSNVTVYNEVTSLRQTYRTFNTFNFQGEHKLFGKVWSPTLSYNLSSSKSSQNDPDFRTADIADKRTLSGGDINGNGLTTDIYVPVVGQVSGINTFPIIADPNARSFRKLTESNYNFKGDFTQPFLVAGLKQIIKFGYNYLKRDRDYTETLVGLPGSYLGGADGLLQSAKGDLNALVAIQNIGLKSPASYDGDGAARVGGFIYQFKKSPNNYKGFYLTKAFYGMLDTRISSSIHLIGGVRFETTEIKANVDTISVFRPVQAGFLSPYDTLKTISPNTSYKTDFKPYYSINLIYTYRKNMNFRFAFNTSLARPEIRELTNIFEFDPFQFALVIGNKDLINQFTRSADFRWEWFPKPDEVISASIFGKQIYNQLTKSFSLNFAGTVSNAPEFPAVQFVNDPEVGKVYGIELEIRKNLGRWVHPLKNFYLGSNILLANSIIQKNKARLDASNTIYRPSPTTSPVFEQAPYSINAYLDYNNKKSGTTLTTSFNIVGERLIQVQVDGTPDIYARPVPVLDFVFSQNLGKRFLLKGFLKNILDPPYEEVYAVPRTGGTFEGQRYLFHSYKRGAEVALGLTYKLF